jgi:hypothetical protein
MRLSQAGVEKMRVKIKIPVDNSGCIIQVALDAGAQKL